MDLLDYGTSSSSRASSFFNGPGGEYDPTSNDQLFFNMLFFNQTFWIVGNPHKAEDLRVNIVKNGGTMSSSLTIASRVIFLKPDGLTEALKAAHDLKAVIQSHESDGVGLPLGEGWINDTLFLARPIETKPYLINEQNLFVDGFWSGGGLGRERQNASSSLKKKRSKRQKTVHFPMSPTPTPNDPVSLGPSSSSTSIGEPNTACSQSHIDDIIQFDDLCPTDLNKEDKESEPKTIPEDVYKNTASQNVKPFIVCQQPGDILTPPIHKESAASVYRSSNVAHPTRSATHGQNQDGPAIITIQNTVTPTGPIHLGQTDKDVNQDETSTCPAGVQLSSYSQALEIFQGEGTSFSSPQAIQGDNDQQYCPHSHPSFSGKEQFPKGQVDVDKIRDPDYVESEPEFDSPMAEDKQQKVASGSISRSAEYNGRWRNQTTVQPQDTVAYRALVDDLRSRVAGEGFPKGGMKAYLIGRGIHSLYTKYGALIRQQVPGLPNSRANFKKNAESAVNPKWQKFIDEQNAKTEVER
ncbi:hypothetical protein I204_01470 [Kwoniella mangroviensis CBS 8886]|nr:hypothetical protein I204_01470 [Kwoniella mangroviensis CBS 8886]